MATGKTNAGGGLSINGIIEQYKVYAGENISAGDFVEFLNTGNFTAGTDTQLSTVANAGSSISAVLLPNGNVFITHSYNGGSYYLYGMVVTINGTTITAGTDTQLSTTTYTGYAVSAVLLPSGNVFIAHSHTSGSCYLYGMVATISGTTVTAGTDTQLSTMTYSGYKISAVLLSNGNIFIAHGNASSGGYLYGMVATISGTTITAGADTQLSTTTYTGYAVSAVLLPSGNVFIAHSRAGGYYLNGMVVTISGTTITAGTDTQLSGTASTGYRISAVLLPSGNVFIAYSRAASYYLNGMVATISGTTVTTGTDTQLSTASYAGEFISAVLLPSGDVFIAHSRAASYYLYGMVVTISGTTVTAGTDAQLSTTEYSGYKISAVLLSNGNIFIAHNSIDSAGHLCGMVMEGEKQVTPYDTTINGVAKTKGTGGETIDVYVPAA